MIHRLGLVFCLVATVAQAAVVERFALRCVLHSMPLDGVLTIHDSRTWDVALFHAIDPSQPIASFRGAVSPGPKPGELLFKVTDFKDFGGGEVEIVLRRLADGNMEFVSSTTDFRMGLDGRVPDNSITRALAGESILRKLGD